MPTKVKKPAKSTQDTNNQGLSTDRITLDVASTPEAYLWVISGPINESGWGRLRNHRSSASQALQGLLEATRLLPITRSVVNLRTASKTLLNAIRDDRAPSRSVYGLMRNLRQQLNDHAIELGQINKTELKFIELMQVLHGAIEAGVLPVSIAGQGLLKFSSYAGIEAGHKPQRLLQLVSNRLDSAAPQFERQEKSYPLLHEYEALPIVVDQISACADVGQGDLLAEIELWSRALNISGVACLFGVTEQTLRWMVRKKQLPSFRIGSSHPIQPRLIGLSATAR